MGQFTLRSFLYSYLIAPVRTIEISPQIKPVKASLFIIFLFSLGSNLGINLSPGKPVFLLIGATFLLQLIIIGLESMMIDFIAQCFGLKPQSLSLFTWLGLSLLPCLLVTPFSLLHHVELFPNILFFFLLLFVIGFTFYLQIKTISILYNVSSFKAFSLLCAPLILIVSIVIFVIVNVVGSVIMEQIL